MLYTGLLMQLISQQIHQFIVTLQRKFINLRVKL